MLRIGDKVVIAIDKRKTDESMPGVLIDLKWNLGLVKLPNGETEWFELTRIYKAAK